MKRVLLSAGLSGACVAALLAPAGAPAAGKSTTVRCRGSERACAATVTLAGGASNKLILIQLPGTSWRAPSVSVSPASSRGAYSLSNRRFTLGGSEYRFILNAVKSNPRGSHLTLAFRKR